ncbi:sulfatase-like hydrolase/transferase [Planctomicrobium sp. SH664]|uniref:sulfatase-like hydrolase/transferase n=1 Tax=Planctomicrobium sp. SH664 TaxID=3448125 RepID=UPI003F5B9826
MKTRCCLFVAALFLIAAPPVWSAQPAKPNIVFILADDLGWGDVEFHGGNAPTPHLNQLAAENLELTQHTVAPVCSPTRAGLMTGRCWSRFGVTSPQAKRALPWDTVTLPAALKQVGYDTCLTGKWHLGSTPEWGPNHFGFDHTYGSLAGGVGPWNHFYKQGLYSKTWHRNGKMLTEEGHVTDLITAEALRWLADRRNNPFFLYVAFTAVHLPLKEPQSWLDKVPITVQGDVARQYAASIMHLDDAVGQILKALEQSGRRESTLVVFTSDNGGSTAENNDRQYPADDYQSGPIPGNNRPFRGKKGDVYEGGIRVPAIVSWPGVVPAGQCAAPCQMTDWMPTFCSLAGVVPERDLHWDGGNIWPVITGTATRDDHPIYTVGPQFRSRSLRLGDWKLIENTQEDRPAIELYDLRHDPGETKNLAAEKPDIVADLQSRLQLLSRADRSAVVKD